MSGDDYARAIIEEGKKRGITERGIVIALATALVESNLKNYANSNDPASLKLPHDAVGSDHMSVGVFQQQNFEEWGDLKCRMDPACSAGTFYDHMLNPAKYHLPIPDLDYNDPDYSPGQVAQNVQRSSFPDRYDERMPEAQKLYDKLSQPRPDFNEYEIWSPSCNDRGGTKIDLFLLHTQEGPGNADSLGQWLANGANNVSYHYTISEDYRDHGVTVVDCVDTDQMSWSVLSANPRSINLCFAGSRASWTKDQWMQQSRAIDTAAYLAVQDCRKYGIPVKVLHPPYTSPPPGIADHKYVTEYLKDGNHTDVGPNFPWPYLTERVLFWATGHGEEHPPRQTTQGGPVGPADDQLNLRWKMLGDQTLVEAVAQLRDKVLGTSDRGKPGAL